MKEMSLSEKFLKAPQSKLVSLVYGAVVLYVVSLAVVRDQAALASVLVPVTVSTLFTMYAVNCMVFGTCTIYAWLTVVLTLLTLVGTVVSVTSASFLKRQDDEKAGARADAMPVAI
jgi:heme exporter protein D